MIVSCEHVPLSYAGDQLFEKKLDSLGFKNLRYQLARNAKRTDKASEEDKSSEKIHIFPIKIDKLYAWQTICLDVDNNKSHLKKVNDNERTGC